MSISITRFLTLRSLSTSLWRSLALWAVSLYLIAGEALAAGGKPATKLVNVADTRALPPGFTRWVADVYNTNLWLYGVLAISIMAGLGLVLGIAFDRMMGLLGIHLGKIEHHE
jgi:hypothetical protein